MSDPPTNDPLRYQQHGAVVLLTLHRPETRPVPRPERWARDAGDAAEAVLDIPPDLRRERRFEINCLMTVRCPLDLTGAWHELAVLANGAQQQRRRIASSDPGSLDGLDYRFTRELAVGEALRLLLRCASRGAVRERLLIEADETAPG